MRLITTPLEIEDIDELAQLGADGLIFGTAFFSVRCAKVMDISQYEEIRQKTRSANVKMLVLVNRFFVEEELDALRHHLLFLKQLQVDGIYFTDEAVLLLAKEYGMEHLLIYQPDTLLTNHPDVNYYLEEGLQQVVLSKEITLSEVLEIAQHTNAEQLEVILHGRVVMMHSKRDLLTNYMEFTGRSHTVKNNRHLIIEEETRKDQMPILEDEHGTHVFSAYIQCGFHELHDLERAGIGAVRIDGILEARAYSKAMLKLYHALLTKTMTPEEAMAQAKQQYPEKPFDSGFYYRPTSTTK